jgi:hypothetical protein
VPGLQLGGIVVGEDGGDLLEQPGRQHLVELRPVVALIEPQEGGVDMRGELTRRGESRRERRDIALAAGQGQEYPANHLPPPSFGRARFGGAWNQA